MTAADEASSSTSSPASAPGSLRRRLLLAAAAFLGIALVLAGLSIGFILHRFVRGQIDGRLDDRIRTLISDNGTGSATRAREHDGPSFDRPRSGWYWQVKRSDAVTGSASLDGHELRLPDLLAGHVTDEPSPADGRGPWGEPLVMRILSIPAGQDGGPATYVATAPMAALRGPVLEALRTLALCLGVIGLFLFGGIVLQVRLGLQPLKRLRADLAQVRAGTRARLPENQPVEIRPLVAEMNGLLDQNAANLEHARAHVANLAHGLKTPLATLAMALSERGIDADGSLSRLTDNMDRRIRHHLRRARAAAVGGPARRRVRLAVHVADLCTAMLRIHADKDVAISASAPDDLAVACDSQDVDEMLGNLIDNACQWCRSQVRIVVTSGRAEVEVLIEDDGPGLSNSEAEEVLERGRRLDESAPGSGFGLPIAMELVELYGGSLRLEGSDLGGLRARLVLPG